MAVLGDGAVAKLQQRLADHSNFGLAKSFFAKGKEMGFDMDTEEGVQAWVKGCNSNPERHQIPLPTTPPHVLLPSRSAVDPEAARRLKLREERKRKKKQAKASRRRNR